MDISEIGLTNKETMDYRKYAKEDGGTLKMVERRNNRKKTNVL